MVMPVHGSRIRGATPQGRYDAVDIGASKKRRISYLELTDETGAGSRQLPPWRRLMSVALIRDCVRNFSTAKSIMRQLRLNVIGSDFTVDINLDDKGSKAAQKWFNTEWAPHASFRDDSHLMECWGLAFDSVTRDGDCGQLFDRDLLQTGRLNYYESDQMCDVTPLPAGYTSHDGVIRDMFGREVGYGVCKLGRGMASVDIKDAFVFKRDPVDDSQNNFKLLRMPWRLNQGRGISDMLTCVADLLDAYEFRSKEMQSAKVAATFAGTITHAEPEADFTDPAYDPEAQNALENEQRALAGSIEADKDGSHEAPQPGETVPLPQVVTKEDDSRNYQVLENLTGGAMEYMAEKDTFNLLDHNRPNVKSIEFVDHIIHSAGTAFGMADAYTRMKATSSYTAFRGDMIMTWVSFSYYQDIFEHHMFDWTAIRAIQFGLDNGLIRDDGGKVVESLPYGWQKYLVWRHPRMPEVDQEKKQNAITLAMKNGLLDLADELGPEWKEKIDRIAKQLDYARAANVPLSAMDTRTGAHVDATDQPVDEGATSNNKGSDTEK